MNQTALMERPTSSPTTTESHPWTPSQVELIHKTVANGASPDELKLFLYYCARSGLDPLRRQVYCIMRGQGEKRRATFQTGIDGYRSLADRTERYAGSDDPVFDEGLSEYEHIVTGRDWHPETASVTVWKLVGSSRYPFTATVRWSEYCPPSGQDAQWKQMPYLMLSKCGEALALRKAFPDQLGGLYTDTEMEQADYIEHVPEPARRPLPNGGAAPRLHAPTPTANRPTNGGNVPRITDEDDPRIHYWASLCGTASQLKLNVPLLGEHPPVLAYEAAVKSLSAAIEKAGGTVPRGDPDLSKATVIDHEPEPPEEPEAEQGELV
jgi:phage recombination protein Bet